MIVCRGLLKSVRPGCEGVEYQIFLWGLGIIIVASTLGFGIGAGFSV